MANTVHVGITVDPSQLQSALSSIQQTIASSSSSFAGSTGIGVAGSTSAPVMMSQRPNIMIPAHPANAVINSSTIPLAAMSAQMDNIMNNVMGRIASGGSLKGIAPDAFVPHMLGPSTGQRVGRAVLGGFADWGGFAAKMAFSEGATSVLAGAGLAAIGMTGAAAAPVVAGLASVASFAGPMLMDKIPIIGDISKYLGGKIDSTLDDLIYGDIPKIDSDKYAKLTFKNMERVSKGGGALALIGVGRSDFLTSDAFANNASKFYDIFNSAVATPRGMQMGDAVKSIALLQALEGTDDLQQIAKSWFKVSNRANGGVRSDKISNAEIASIKSRIKALSQRANKEINQPALEAGVSPAQIALARLDYEKLASLPAVKISGWKIMGRNMGRAVGYGDKWGEGWTDSHSHIKRMATSTLGLRTWEKKALGGSKRIAASFMNEIYGNLYYGGRYQALLAPMMKGITPGSVYEWGGQVASGLLTANDQVHWLYKTHDMIGDMGGKVMTATYRKGMLEELKMFREQASLSESMSNEEALTVYLQQAYGVKPIQARARAAMILGLGKKIWYKGSAKYRALDRRQHPILFNAFNKILSRSYTSKNVKSISINAPIWSREIMRFENAGFINKATVLLNANTPKSGDIDIEAQIKLLRNKLHITKGAASALAQTYNKYGNLSQESMMKSKPVEGFIGNYLAEIVNIRDGGNLSVALKNKRLIYSMEKYTSGLSKKERGRVLTMLLAASRGRTEAATAYLQSTLNLSREEAENITHDKEKLKAIKLYLNNSIKVIGPGKETSMLGELSVLLQKQVVVINEYLKSHK